MIKQLMKYFKAEKEEYYRLYADTLPVGKVITVRQLVEGFEAFGGVRK